MNTSKPTVRPAFVPRLSLGGVQLAWIWLVFALTVPLFASTPEPPATVGELSYVFEVSETSGSVTLRTTWTPTQPTLETTFRLCAGGWGNIENCRGAINELEIQGTSAETPASGESWTVPFQDGNASFSFTYSRTEKPSSDPDIFRRPMMTDRWLHLVGHTALPIPEKLGRDDPIRVTFDASALVSRFGPVTISWAPGKPSVSRTVKAEDLGNVLITAGGRVSGRSEGARLNLSEVYLPGEKELNPSHLSKQALTLLRGYLAFYGATGVNQTLVFVPVAAAGTEHPKINGITLPGVISLMLPENADWKDSALRRNAVRFLAHELGHIWIGQTLRAGASEGELAWFIEGFTNYIARKILYRTRIYTLEDYIWDLNQTVIRYQKDPNRQLDNRELAQHALSAQGYLRMTPYLRGDLIALWIDQRLHNEKGTSPELIDILRRLLSDPLMHNLKFPDLLTHLEAPLSEHDRVLFRRMVLTGEPVPLVPTSFARCLALTWSEKTASFVTAPKGGAAACPGLL